MGCKTRRTHYLDGGQIERPNTNMAPPPSAGITAQQAAAAYQAGDVGSDAYRIGRNAKMAAEKQQLSGLSRGQRRRLKKGAAPLLRGPGSVGMAGLAKPSAPQGVPQPSLGPKMPQMPQVPSAKKTGAGGYVMGGGELGTGSYLGLADGGNVFDATQGGVVPPGPPGVDTVPADTSAGPVMLDSQPGQGQQEYVLPADTTEAVGVENLDALKDMTHAPGEVDQRRELADGGVTYSPWKPVAEENREPMMADRRQRSVYGQAGPDVPPVSIETIANRPVPNTRAVPGTPGSDMPKPIPQKGIGVRRSEIPRTAGDPIQPDQRQASTGANPLNPGYAGGGVIDPRLEEEAPDMSAVQAAANLFKPGYGGAVAPPASPAQPDSEVAAPPATNNQPWGAGEAKILERMRKAVPTSEQIQNPEIIKDIKSRAFGGIGDTPTPSERAEKRAVEKKKAGIPDAYGADAEVPGSRTTSVNSPPPDEPSAQEEFAGPPDLRTVPLSVKEETEARDLLPQGVAKGKGGTYQGIAPGANEARALPNDAPPTPGGAGFANEYGQTILSDNPVGATPTGLDAAISANPGSAVGGKRDYYNGKFVGGMSDNQFSKFKTLNDKEMAQRKNDLALVKQWRSLPTDSPLGPNEFSGDRRGRMTGEVRSAFDRINANVAGQPSQSDLMLDAVDAGAAAAAAEKQKGQLDMDKAAIAAKAEVAGKKSAGVDAARIENPQVAEDEAFDTNMTQLAEQQQNLINVPEGQRPTAQKAIMDQMMALLKKRQEQRAARLEMGV